MTNKEIIQNIHPDFYNKRAHVRRRVLIGFEVEEAMNAARKDEALKFLEYAIFGLGMMDGGNGKIIQIFGNGTSWTVEQLYELFKQNK